MERPTFRVRAFDAVAGPREFEKLILRLDREHVSGRMVLQIHRVRQ